MLQYFLLPHHFSFNTFSLGGCLSKGGLVFLNAVFYINLHIELYTCLYSLVTSFKAALQV